MEKAYRPPEPLSFCAIFQRPELPSAPSSDRQQELTAIVCTRLKAGNGNGKAWCGLP
jgi:hypothetical protein